MNRLITSTAPYTITTTDPARDLEDWHVAIATLSDALTDAAAARLNLDRLHRTLEAVEASLSQTVEGKNAEERKARLVLALNDDARHQRTITAIDCERARLLDAERRITTNKERCRLLRASLALHTSHEQQHDTRRVRYHRPAVIHPRRRRTP